MHFLHISILLLFSILIRPLPLIWFDGDNGYDDNKGATLMIDTDNDNDVNDDSDDTDEYDGHMMILLSPLTMLPLIVVWYHKVTRDSNYNCNFDQNNVKQFVKFSGWVPRFVSLFFPGYTKPIRKLGSWS